MLKLNLSRLNIIFLLFSINLLGKKISSLRLYITDSYGRLIPEVSVEQLKCSGIAFACSFKVIVSV